MNPTRKGSVEIDIDIDGGDLFWICLALGFFLAIGFAAWSCNRTKVEIAQVEAEKARLELARAQLEAQPIVGANKPVAPNGH